MKIYLDVLHRVMNEGISRPDRTKTGTRGLFGMQMHFDLTKGFPLITTKKIYTNAVIHELLWFLSGDTNVQYLRENNVKIWDEWADKNGELGPIYGKQWRSWNACDYSIDQIANVIERIKTDPFSRRLIVSSWNVSDLPKMALPPCHALFQFYVADNKLSCQLYQRSADLFLGVPFNIASYALLTHMIAQQCNLNVGNFVWTGGDCHIYNNHFEAVNLQLQRAPLPLPTLNIKRKPESISHYQRNDFGIENYHHHPSIKAPISV